ncbi:MAG: helix-turn-helix domain-containing protein [Bacteroidota bacterium]
MQPIRPRPTTTEEREQLALLYHATRSARLRTRAQALLLAIEQQMHASQIAPITRMSEQSIRRWIRRFNAEGVKGLHDAPRPGKAKKASPSYRERLLQVVRQRPRSLGEAYSLWTLARLADFMAEETGERVSHESVRRYLLDGDIVLSRPQHTITSPDPDYQAKKGGRRAA